MNLKWAMLSVFFGAVLSASSALSAEEERCIDYHTPGVSDCRVVQAELEGEEAIEPAEEPDEEVFQKPQPPKPNQPTLEQRVDQFMEDYGKPPREFVAFSLEPTLDNALIWAQKYREMMSRNQRLTEAWRQAQQILSAREERDGEDIPALPNALPPVPDFTPQLEKEARAAKQKTFAEAQKAAGVDVSTNSQKFRQGRIGGAENSAPVININYYFSAQCPYCKKFEKGFQSVIKGMEGRLAVTCVDMTPSGKEKSNIFGKVDCKWRPVQLGESQRFGVESTPTLIIDRGLGGSLERLAGYVDAQSLEKYLRGE